MDERVSEFLESKSKETRRLYRGSFKLFQKYAETQLDGELSGDDLIRMIAEDRKRDIEERKRPEIKILKGFFDWLKDEAPRERVWNGRKKGYALKTCHRNLSAITEFLNYYELPVKRKRLSLPRATRGRNNRKMNIRREQVREMVDHAKLNRDKAIILCLWQSGMGIGDLLSLNVADVMVEDPVRGSLDDPPLLVKLIREKTDVDYRTFFGKDACEALNRYLDERGRTQGRLERGDPLFVQQRKQNGGYERLTKYAVDMTFRRLAVRSGLVSEEKMKEGMNPARPHSLRSGFSSALKEEGVNQSIIDGLTGHAVSYDSAYSIHTDKQLRELYKEHEDVLSIETVSIPREDEIEEAVKRHFGEMGVERIMPELRQKIQEQGDEVSQLREEVRGLRKKVEKIDRLGELLKAGGELGDLEKIIEKKVKKALED